MRNQRWLKAYRRQQAAEKGAKEGEGVGYTSAGVARRTVTSFQDSGRTTLLGFWGFSTAAALQWKHKPKTVEARPSSSKGVEGGKLKGNVEVPSSGTEVSIPTSADVEMMVDVSEIQHCPQSTKPCVPSDKLKEKNCDKLDDQKDKGVDPSNGPPLLVASMVKALRVYDKPRRGPPIQTSRTENRFSILSSDEGSDADDEEEISQESIQHLGDGPIPVVGNNVGSPKSGTSC
ncbi:hypothetical protein L6452_42169 [Arctium lappa]|uniref:Uncharacterized protein n=1 Tax=Arctium lappa TaxID=4217 RepID=A0ACB8XHG5_ARCLA|nr:hypothetical protein L6452_42169 [Arctium lappa]